MSDALPTASVPDEAIAVLHFWFIELMPENWFGSSEEIDREIESRFADLLEKAASGALDHWADTPRGRLALIIVLDQFSRNIHRDSALAYTQDTKAQALVCEALDGGEDERLGMDERQFLYMPLMHAEDIELQQRGIERFTALAGTASNVIDYARKHRDIIERFGRFPYRNEVLERLSTDAERKFVEEEGNPFS
ncbi:DUF924 family protein [Erythrobacter rubeus]|uniref:DUF924 domain-containing protein n=1 Tax=Erythrobacter rubeus TaxID=2760803 RepID=A0ABR8KMZ7_9SPHN|nr:DUF924 family protein [Erythrobacter rubeus]MBD2841967.1 DUF924 domain-containing protein [Erythrobacter rubeus]